MIHAIVTAVALWLFADLIDWSWAYAAPVIIRVVPAAFLLPVLAVLAVLYIVQRKTNLRMWQFAR